MTDEQQTTPARKRRSAEKLQVFDTAQTGQSVTGRAAQELTRTPGKTSSRRGKMLPADQFLAEAGDLWLETRGHTRHTARPYVLESSVIEDDLRRAAANAQSEIDAIQADILSIAARTNEDISAIQARADAEIASRNQRRDDLERILALAARALDLPAEPTLAPAGSLNTFTQGPDTPPGPTFTLRRVTPATPEDVIREAQS